MTDAHRADLHGSVVEVLSDGLALTVDEIDSALRKHGHRLDEEDPRGHLLDVLEEVADSVIMPIDDDRYAALPTLLRDVVLTHRVSGDELAGDYLEVGPDLEPFSLLTDAPTYRRFTRGGTLLERSRALDFAELVSRDIDADAPGDAVWLLEPGTLSGLGLDDGDLLGVACRADGFELVARPDTGPTDAVAAHLAEVTSTWDAPRQLGELVWLVVADVPALVETPLPPLGDLLSAAGLPWDGEQVGPPGFDFAEWREAVQVEAVAERHGLDVDQASSVVELVGLFDDVLQLVEAAQAVAADGGDPATVLDDEPSVDLGPFDLRPLLGDLADPAVAAALAVEILGVDRDRAPALGVFAESLERKAPREAKGALRWLQGKARERLGDVLAAEAAYDAATTLGGADELATYELARIASDRGDADRGLSLLRRVGAPADDPLVELLEHFRPVERSGIGRNDRCWCGSGRKYKVCHRGREQHPLEERAAWLYQKAGAYLQDGPWRSLLIDLAVIRSAHDERPGALWQALTDPLVADAALFEGGAFAAFLDERGVLLPDDEALLAQQWLLVERSVHEVEDVTPGEGFTARDVRTGERQQVRERIASATLRPGSLVCARIVPAGGTAQVFGGLEPVALRERDGLVELLDDDPEPEDVVRALSARFAPPLLQTTDGDDLVFCKATLRGDDPTVLREHLDATYDAADTADLWHQLDGSRVLATLRLDAGTLVVETAGEARLERVLDALLDERPDLEVVDDVRTPAADLMGADTVPAVAGPQPGREDPAVRELLAQVIREHETAWLDESIPALAGATPREAAADPTRRPDLVRLLDSFPDIDADDETQMSAARLRAALGLSATPH